MRRIREQSGCSDECNNSNNVTECNIESSVAWPEPSVTVSECNIENVVTAPEGIESSEGSAEGRQAFVIPEEEKILSKCHVIETEEELDDFIKFVDDYLDMNMSAECQRNISLLYLPYTSQLRRGEHVTHIVIGTQSREVYVFDLALISSETVLERLRPILEDRYRDKVVYDGKVISDVLQSTYNCMINSVVDVQILEVMFRTASKAKLMLLEEFCTKLNPGLQEHALQIKKCWHKKSSCSQDEVPCSLLYIINHTLFTYIEQINPSVENWTIWWVNSTRYTHLFRDKECRTYDQYEHHEYLPTNILSVGGAQVQGLGVVRCRKCRRYLPSSSYNKEHYKAANCTTCVLVDGKKSTRPATKATPRIPTKSPYCPTRPTTVMKSIPRPSSVMKSSPCPSIVVKQRSADKISNI